MGLKELEIAWNSQADRHNQWRSLGFDEMVEFAQQTERMECASMIEEVARIKSTNKMSAEILVSVAGFIRNKT